MRRLFYMFLLSACICQTLPAQEDQNDISCRSDQEKNTAYKKKLWDGYEISLGPMRDQEGAEFRCTAAIYDRAGKVVFRTSGFNVTFDENLTGQDFDGDGKPDVVFQTDTGGGNHCCWGYIMYSLSPKPHKLFEIAMEGRVDFEKDKDGKMVIWERVSAPGAFGTSMADRPFAAKVFRVLEGKLVDSTPEFCGTNDERFERHQMTPEEIAKLANAKETGSGEDENIISALESRTAQHVYCHEYDEALKDINLWPAGKRELVIENLSDALGKEYPEFTAKLQQPPKNN
jgi:hypothetical protein